MNIQIAKLLLIQYWWPIF